MKYEHTETGEVWNEGQPSTKQTSNFYLLSHQEKLARGWTVIEEPATPVIAPVIQTLEQTKAVKKELIKGKAVLAISELLDMVEPIVAVHEQLLTDLIEIDSLTIIEDVNNFDVVY